MSSAKPFRRSGVVFLAYFALFFVPTAMAFGLAISVSYRSGTRAHVVLLNHHMRQRVEAIRREFLSELKGVASDVAAIAGNADLPNVLKADSSERRRRFAAECVSFAAAKPFYAQIRLIDATGMEVVRINSDEGRPEVVAESGLQNKVDRYYVAATLALRPGQVYVSPLDLNVEHDQIEYPFKPLLRIATPVADKSGAVCGIVVVNYLARSFLSRLETSDREDPRDTLALVDAEGYWIRGPHPEDAWGPQLHHERAFSRSHPEAWASVRAAEKGLVHGRDGLLAFTTVGAPSTLSNAGSDALPGAVASGLTPTTWKIVSRVTPEAFDAELRPYRERAATLFLLTWTPSAIGAIVLAWVMVRRRSMEHVLRVTQATVDCISDGVFWVDSRGRILSVNDAACQRLGYSRDELTRMFVWDIDPNYTREVWPGHIEELRRRRTMTIQTEHRARDGHVLPVEILLTMLDFAGAEYHCAFVRDISERKRTEAALRESEEKYRTLFEGSADGVLLMTDVFLDCNEQACRMWQCTREEILGRTPADFSPPLQPDGRPSSEKAQELICAALAGAPQVFTWKHVRRDGSLWDAEVALKALTLNGQRVLQAVMRDVTRRVQAEGALQQAKAAAESASRAKSDFLANMSHEIRSPLTAILGYLDLIRDGCSGRCDYGSSCLRDHAETIGRHAHHLLQVINDILDLSKIEAGMLRVERVRCSPMQLLAEVQSMMQVRAAEKGLALDCEYVSSMAETIATDPTRVRQILINLVGNAVKFTDSGGVRIVARLLDPHGDAPVLRIDVVDTGIGMSEDEMRTVFDRFVQANAAQTERYGGTGLGLTISKRLAALLGGDLTVQSSPGAGSMFRLTIPTGMLAGVRLIHDPAAADRPASASETGRAAEPITPLNARILLVEDGLDNQRLIAFILKKAGADVTIAENGEAAVRTALAALNEARPFDLILMDIQMPVMDGFEATRRLRHGGYGGPILALTAHAMAGDRERCLEAGCTGYISKPLDRAEFFAVIRESLVRCDAASAPPPVTSGSATPAS